MPPGPSESRLRTIAVGAAAGLTSGLLGVGGGIVMVPGLTGLVGMAQRRAHATSLAAIVPIGLTGATAFAVGCEVNYALAAWLAAGAIAGAPLGARAMSRIPEFRLRLVFAGVALAVGGRYLLGGASGLDACGAPDAIGASGAIVAVIVGAFAGAYAGLLGVGGGVVMVPAMVSLLGQSQHVAEGTSLLVIIPTAIAGTRSNLRRGLVDRRAATLLAGGGVAAAAGGAALAIGVGDELLLKRLFGVLLVAIAVRMFLAPAGPPAASED